MPPASTPGADSAASAAPLSAPMTLLRAYVFVYFLLVLGAVASLWAAGILVRLPLVWVALAVMAAIGIGVLLLVVSSDRPTPAD